MHVLITGAGGFIGRSVVRKARARGWDVTAIARRPCPVADRIADLREPIENWPVPDAVIHLAGAYAGASWRDFEASDIQIARNLIAWGQRVGVRRWIIASAAEVYGSVAGVADENWACRPVIPYGFAKLQVERMFHTAGLPYVTICRLGEVYGREGRILREIPNRLRAGFCPWPGDGNIRISFLHVDDAAEALVRACARAAPASAGSCDIYNAGDLEPATWRQFLDRIAASLGSRRATFLPYTLARCYALFEWWGSRLLRRPGAVTPWVLKLVTTPKVLSCRRIQVQLGFTPKYQRIECGLREALSEV
jgi:UDP-glucose 4-epimerase